MSKNVTLQDKNGVQLFPATTAEQVAFSSTANLKQAITSVTPEIFGAVGDGVTDDTSAIQAAVNSGKNVVFSNKTYVCGLINVNENDVIIDGRGATLLHGGNSGFIISYTSHDITICNFNSVCTYVKDSQQATNIHIGINANADSPNSEYYAKNIIISNCSFTGGVMGFSASSAKNIIIENCKFSGFVYKPEDLAGGYGILLQSCVDVHIDICEFIAGAYGRHDIYVSVDQRKNQYTKCRNVSINNCTFDHSNLELDADNLYYSPNTVAINVRTSTNVIVENSYFTDVTGAVAFYSQDGSVDCGVFRNCIVNNPVLNSGSAETRQIINCASSNYTKDIQIESISLSNVPDNYGNFLSLVSCNVRVFNCNIAKTRIIVNASVNIVADNITTTIPYYFCRFNNDVTGFISHIYFADTLTGKKYYYASGINTSGLTIKDDEPVAITVTPNDSYIGTVTNNSYKSGKVGVISFYFKVNADIPTGTTFATIDESLVARTDAITFRGNAFGGAVYIAKTGEIKAGTNIATNGSFYFVTIPVILA